MRSDFGHFNCAPMAALIGGPRQTPLTFAVRAAAAALPSQKSDGAEEIQSRFPKAVAKCGDGQVIGP